MSIKKSLRNFFHRLRGELPTESYTSRGMKVGKNLNRMGGVIFDYSHCWHITIGDNVTLAPRVHILAHDASTFKLSGYTRVGNVVIGDNVFVGAGSIILPGVTIGDNSVIGAGSIVVDSIPADSVAVGSPARVVGTIDEFKAKMKRQMQGTTLFGEEYTERGGITPAMKQEMVDCCEKNGCAFVK